MSQAKKRFGPGPEDGDRRGAASRLAWIVALGVAAAVCSPPGTRTARADATWTGATSQDWNTAANWSSSPADPGGNFFVNTAAGNTPILAGDSAFTPVDVILGDGAANTGRFDHAAGTLSLANTGTNGNWFFVGRGGGTGSYNLADTAVAGTGITGFGIGSGSVNVGKIWVGGSRFFEGGTGTLNINTTGGINANSTQDFGSTRAALSAGYGAGSSGTINLENGTINANSEVWVGFSGTATFNQAGGTVNSTEYFVVGRNSGANGTYNLTGGTVNAASSLGFAVLGSFAGAAGTLNVSGGTFGVSNSAQLLVGEGGTGTLNVSGTGLVTVNHATQGLRLGANGGTGTVNLNGGIIETSLVSKGGTGTGTFNFNGGTLRAAGGANPDFMAGLTRANVRNGGAVIDTNGSNLTIAQALEHSNVDGDNATDGGLTKTGGGALTLTGNSTYTGATTVSAGTLVFGGAGAVTATTGATSVADDAGLGVTVGATGTTRLTTSGLALGSSGTAGLAFDFNNLANPTVPIVSDTGSLVVAGSAVTLTLANVSKIGNGTITLIDYGGAALSGSDFAKFTQAFQLGPRSQGTLVNNTASTRLDLAVATVVPVWRGDVDGNWDKAEGPGDTGGTLNFRINNGTTATAYWESAAPGDSVLFADTYNGVNAPATTNITITEPLNPTGVTVNNSALNYTFGGTEGMGGAMPLTKNGTASLTINNPNTYTGGTTLNAGTLNVNNASALGTGAVTINGGALGNTSGSAVTLSANNAQAWNGDFAFAGPDELDMGTGAVTVGGTADRAVSINASTLTVGELKTATGQGFTKQGAGKLVLTSVGTGANGSAVNGVLNVTGGTLQFNRGGTDAAGSGDLAVAGISGGGTITNGAAVERWVISTSTGTLDFAGTLANGDTGGLGFNKKGAGAQTLSGTNSYTGATTVDAGTLVLKGANTGAGTNATVNAGNLVLANTSPLGGSSLIRLAGNNVSTLTIATDGGDTVYSLTQGTTTNSTIVSDRATPGAGINHTLTTQTGANGVGGGTITFTSGANVTSGAGTITFTQLGLGAGSVQTTLLNPTTAVVTVGDVAKQNNNISQTLGLGGTTAGNQVTGVISNGAPLTGTNAVSVSKSDTSTWTLSNANTYTGGTTVSGGTLVMADPAALGTGGVTLAGGTLVVRTDGGDTAYNLGMGNTNVATLASDVKTGGAGINHTLGSLSMSTATTLNVVAGPNVTTGSPSITLGTVSLNSGFGAGTSTLNPTTASLTVGAVSSTTAGEKTLVLDGTSPAGNAVAGVIADGASTVALTKSNTGTWALTTANTYTGATTVAGGTLRVSGSVADSSGVSVTAAGARFQADSTQTLKALSVADGAAAEINNAADLRVLTVKAMPALSTTGKLDLGKNALIVDDGALDHSAAVVAEILKGFNATGPASGDGKWDGNKGITSADAQATYATATPLAVGWARASELLGIGGPAAGTWLGQSGISASATLVRTVISGDVDLDGAVGFADLLKVAQNYDQAGPAVVWFTGDINYDQTVGFADLLAVAQNYDKSLALPADVPGASADFNADWQAALAQVPEPGAVSLLAIGALALLGIRRPCRAPGHR